MYFPLLADLVLAIHVAVVIFVVGGFGFIVAGGLCGWESARARGFRLAHLAAIAVIAGQSWLGALCPLTTLEMWLRTQASQDSYAGSFIEHWLQWLLYYDAPAWVFTLAYTLFGLAVAAAWRWFPPRSRARR